MLYMHDGQNVFDTATSFAGEWGADEAAEELARRGLETIIVAIPNGGAARVDEYGPWVHSRRGQAMGGKGEAYARFLLETVRPVIDGSWRTLTDERHTGIAGSSMGGLISLYSALAHPGVFGYCAALSPSLWFGGKRIFDLVKQHGDARLRLYLDMGLIEDRSMLINPHVRNTRRLRDLLLEAGMDVVYVEDEHGRHSEADWRRRFPTALEWFLDPTARPSTRAVTTATTLGSMLSGLSRLLPNKR